MTTKLNNLPDNLQPLNSAVARVVAELAVMNAAKVNKEFDLIFSIGELSYEIDNYVRGVVKHD